MEASHRPTRSQQTLLSFIASFIKEHGYGPSYREIMRALDYKSVSTVAIHIDGLVAKGQLRKHGRSARSLEVVSSATAPTDPHVNEHEAWLVKTVETYAASADQDTLRKMAHIFGQLQLREAAAKAASYLR